MRVHNGFENKISETLSSLDKNHHKWYKKIGIGILNLLWGVANICFGIPGKLKQKYGTNKSFFFSLHGNTYDVSHKAKKEIGNCVKRLTKN